MNRKQLWAVVLCQVAGIVLCGCAGTPNIKQLNEQEIAKQEAVANQARDNFHTGKYEGVAEQLKPLLSERSTSQPLYNCELGAFYLAQNDKASARPFIHEAYTSLEEFYPSLEKKAVSLWGAESDKVFKGDPYEQAMLGLFMGILFLEEGDVDNALACFKNAQLSDSDVEKETYKCDFGLLQLLEARCHQFRNESDDSVKFMEMACHSFSSTHPQAAIKRMEIQAKYPANKETPEEERLAKIETEAAEAEQAILAGLQPYYSPVQNEFNTLLLIWNGRAPVSNRGGTYGEIRYLIQNPGIENHFELLLDGTQWYDVIHGFANVTFQASTRGGRMMDNVLASQAAFKSTAAGIGNAFLDAADDTGDPYAALVMLALGAISHGIGAAANAKADIRCWQILPDDLAILPVQLTPGTHTLQVDCYKADLKMNRSFNYQIAVQDQPFQFFNLVTPSIIPAPQPAVQPEGTAAADETGVEAETEPKNAESSASQM